MNKRLWLILAVLVIVVIGGMVWWKNSQNGAQNYVEFLNENQLLAKQDIINAQNKAANNGELAKDFQPEGTIIPDHFTGKKDSKIVVIQYEDFACSACISFAPKAAEILNDYKDKALFIHRHFNLGQNTSTISESAAEAAYLLADENMFWKMNDLIFSDQTCIEGGDKDVCEARLMTYAEHLGLDVDEFKTTLSEFTTNGIQAKIQRDKALGIKAGISATPTWFINGKKVEGGSDTNIRNAIDEAIKKQTK